MQAQWRVCSDTRPHGAGAYGQDANVAGLPGRQQPTFFPVLCTQRHPQVSKRTSIPDLGSMCNAAGTFVVCSSMWYAKAACHCMRCHHSLSWLPSNSRCCYCQQGWLTYCQQQSQQSAFILSNHCCCQPKYMHLTHTSVTYIWHNVLYNTCCAAMTHAGASCVLVRALSGRGHPQRPTRPSTGHWLLSTASHHQPLRYTAASAAEVASRASTNATPVMQGHASVVISHVGSICASISAEYHAVSIVVTLLCVLAGLGNAGVHG